MSCESGEDQDIAISLKGVRKSFQIYDKPHHRLIQGLFRGRKQFFRDFVALDDISFEIRKGETVGIIGRNGAGKSTLLQIICGTLTPTSGAVEINGRVAALLELGSGFNPEFTGRENVFMNGSILGLTQEEIESRFDDIAAFADIGDFMEQPVKTYSSGMYVRLAFAVIAHVDADILVIDEALSVGDAVFTQKCMRFIHSFKKQGTLLFVSHDMSSILTLCENAVWLSQGTLRRQGNAKTISEEYLQYTLQEVYKDGTKLISTKKPNHETEKKELQPPSVTATVEQKKTVVNYESTMTVEQNLSQATGWRTGDADVTGVSLEKVDSNDDGTFQGGEQVRLIIEAEANKDLDKPILGFCVRDRLGQDLFGENTLVSTDRDPVELSAGGKISAEFVFTLPMLPNGEYPVMASVANGTLYSNVQHHLLHDALFINVSSSKVRWGLVGVFFEKVSMRKIG